MGTFFSILGMSLKWIISNWKLSLLIIFASWVGWLYWDRLHLLKKVDALNISIVKIEGQNKTLTDSSKAITSLYSSTLRDKIKVEKDLAISEQKRIQNDKILRSYSIPSIAVRVFNDPTTSDNSKTAPNTKQGNVTGTTGSGSVVIDPASPSGKTLADLLAAGNENRHRLLSCIDTVHAWQGFWNDFVSAVKLSAGETP